MKFVVLDMDEARKRAPDLMAAEGLGTPTQWMSDPWGLFEEDDNGVVVRLVATDGGDPEDQLLVRNWDWVPREMNKLASEITSLREARRRAEEALRGILFHGISKPIDCGEDDATWWRLIYGDCAKIAKKALDQAALGEG